MIARMLAGYVAIFWISELDGMIHQLRLSPAWWDVVLLPALAVSIGGLVRNAATRRPIAGFAGGHALVILGAVFVEIFVGTTPPDAVPWLWPMTGVAVVCATAAWGLRWAALYGAALSTVWIVLRLLPEGGAKAVPFAVSDGLFILVGGIGVGSIAAGMIRAGREADNLAHQVARSETSAAVTKAWSDERDRLDRLVHDEVLTALALAANASEDTTLEIRQLASRTLDQVDTMADSRLPGGTLSADLWCQLAEATASQVSPRVQFDRAPLGFTEEADLPATVVEALISAMREALRNAISHASADTVQASCSLHAGADGVLARVVVSDDGVGFDASTVGMDRLGIQNSLVARMNSVGGTCVISSAPGHGTQVVLAWSSAAASLAGVPTTSGDVDAPQFPAAFSVRQLIATMWLSLFASFGIALANLETVTNPLPWLVSLATAIGFVAIAVHVGPALRLRSPAATACVILIALTSILVITNVDMDHALGWSAWHGYISQLAVAVLVVRGRPWHATAGSLALISVYVWRVIAAGTDPFATLMPFALGPIAFLIIAIVVVRTLRTIATQEAALRTRRRVAVDEAARRYVGLVQRALWAADVRAVAGPALELVASGAGPVSNKARDRAQVAERTLREALVARHLMSDELASITDDARRRGIDLDFVDSRHAQLPAEVKRTITLGLRQAVTSSAVTRVVVRLAPAGSPESATIVNDDGDGLLVMTVNPDGSSSVADTRRVTEAIEPGTP